MNSYLNKALHKIRNIGVFFLKNYSLILRIYNSFYRLINKQAFYAEIDLRKNLSIFDYEKLSEQIPYFPLEKIKDANFYGQLNSIKKYTHLNLIDSSIEHGLYLGNYVPNATFLKTTKSIITFSENRKKHLLAAGIVKPVFAIGPYIHYAEPLLCSNEIKRLKQSLGKTLLLFPSHSINNSNATFEVNELIKEVKEIAKEFSTVLTCLYYKDIQNGYFIKQFESAGFRIVTAGHQLDINFLSRLKMIIQLSDYTISNTVGTHTGYCVYMGKPHYIINQKIEHKTDSDSKPVSYRDNEQQQSLKREKHQIMKEFTYRSDTITNAQRDVIDKYWGLSLIKQPDELKEILTNS